MIGNVVWAIMNNKVVKFLKNYREGILALLGAAIIFMIGSYRYQETFQPIVFSDEYGYWATSAFFLGEDWK